MGRTAQETRRADRFPEIPDFTNVSWQAQRTDAQLLESILDGKGEDMPPVRGKISEQQARGLVAFIRAFAPTPGKPEQAEQEGPGLDELPEAESPRSFFEKLARWLGKIHPPAVHFPIALLTAAAVAELLRMSTGKPAFDAISRYCIWFGTLTAVIAGALGCVRGKFSPDRRFLGLDDASLARHVHGSVCWVGVATERSEPQSRSPQDPDVLPSCVACRRDTRIGHRVLWRRGGLRPQSLHLAEISIGFLAPASSCARTGGRRPFSEGATAPVCSWLHTNWRTPSR